MRKDNGLALSIVDLPRQVGFRREETVNWKVPDTWNTEVLTLQPGQVVPLQVAFTAVDDGVYAQVSGHVDLVGECSRCLEPLVVPIDIEAHELYTEEPDRRQRRKSDGLDSQIDVEGDDLDPDLLIVGDEVNLEPMLRDAIFSEAPMNPVCSQDCLGMCEHCGILLRDAEPGHHHEFLDPRFAALATLLEDPPEGGPAGRNSNQ